jgi:hypothetical protein
MPSTSTSITLPAGGASANPHNLTHCATITSVVFMLEPHACCTGSTRFTIIVNL